MFVSTLAVILLFAPFISVADAAKNGSESGLANGHSDVNIGLAPVIPSDDGEIPQIPLPEGTDMNMTIPYFGIPYDDRLINVYTITAGTSNLVVFYYMPAMTLLPELTMIQLNNLTSPDCVMIRVRMWDQRYIRRIRTFLAYETGIQKPAVLPFPFRWMRIDYNTKDDGHVDSTESSWKPVGSLPSIMTWCIRCQTAEACQRIRASVEENPVEFASNVDVSFSYTVPTAHDIDLCLDDQFLYNTPMFTAMRNRFPEEQLIFMARSEYSQLVDDFVGLRTDRMVVLSGEVVTDEEIDRIKKKVYAMAMHNITSASSVTERMRNLTYSSNTRLSHQHNAQEPLYCINVTSLLFQPALCTIPVRVFPRTGDYTTNLHVPQAVGMNDALQEEEDIFQETIDKWMNGTRGFVQRLDAVHETMKNVNLMEQTKMLLDAIKQTCTPVSCPIPPTCPSLTCPPVKIDPVPKCLMFPKSRTQWTVRDAETTAPISKEAISAKLQDENGTVLNHVVENTSEFAEFAVSLPIVDGYEIIFEILGYHQIKLGNFSHLLNFDQNTFMEPLLFMSKRLAGSGILTGGVVGVPPNRTHPAFKTLQSSSCRIEFRTGFNNLTGPGPAVVASKLPDNPPWEINLPMGYYTATARCPGYLSASRTLIVMPGKNSPYDFILMESVRLGTDTLRVIWSGGIHGHYFQLSVQGPGEGTAKRERVDVPYGDTGGISSDGLMEYRHHGTGTLASVLIKKQLPGPYRVALYYSSHKLTPETEWNFANSNSTVQVYRGDNLLGQYFVPNRKGNAWSVVEIDGMRLTPLNEMRTVSALDDIHP